MYYKIVKIIIRKDSLNLCHSITLSSKMKRRYSSLLTAYSQSLISTKNQTRFEIFKKFLKILRIVRPLPTAKAKLLSPLPTVSHIGLLGSGLLVNLFSNVIEATSTCIILQMRNNFWNFRSLAFDLTWKKVKMQFDNKTSMRE